MTSDGDPNKMLTVKEAAGLLKVNVNEPLSRKRINNILVVLSKILRYAKELEIIDAVPAIKALKLPPQKFDFFEPGELEQLLEASSSEPKWRTAILVAGETGLRMGEIQELAGHASLSVTSGTCISDRPRSGIAIALLVPAP